MSNIKVYLSIISLMILSGCAANKNLYNWGTYEPQVYNYFKGGSPEQQVLVLEKHLAEINAKGGMPPPGFYAHLAMLYGRTGRDSEVMGMFEMEKKIYPESTIFINNIISGFKVAK